MRGLSAWFFGSALIYGVVGLVFGLIINPIGAHNQVPTHAHLLDIGWLSFALFGFFYRLFAERAALDFHAICSHYVLVPWAMPAG
jgi:hypothetical protein